MLPTSKYIFLLYEHRSHELTSHLADCPIFTHCIIKRQDAPWNFNSYVFYYSLWIFPGEICEIYTKTAEKLMTCTKGLLNIQILIIYFMWKQEDILYVCICIVTLIFSLNPLVQGLVSHSHLDLNIYPKFYTRKISNMRKLHLFLNSENALVYTISILWLIFYYICFITFPPLNPYIDPPYFLIHLKVSCRHQYMSAYI